MVSFVGPYCPQNSYQQRCYICRKSTINKKWGWYTMKKKLETVPIYVENNQKKKNLDSSKAALEYEEQETIESKAPEVRQSTR